MIGIVTALGVTQIIGYGTLYYAYAILAPDVAREFVTDAPTLFGIFSAGLLAGGLVAPYAGRLMDRHGPPTIMTLGSIAVSLVLAAIGLAPNLFAFAALAILLEIASITVLYEAAFATLAFFAGPGARRPITHLTLFGAIASTIFWPLTGWIAAEFGWRATYFVYALVNLGVAFPLHAWLRRMRRGTLNGSIAPQVHIASPWTPLTGRDAQIAFIAIATGFALSGAVVAAIGVHLVLILQSLGLGAASYAASMVMGPAQALIRLTDALFFKGYHPLIVAIISGLAVPAAVPILFVDASPVVMGFLFAALFGIGQGLSSIVKGGVPLALFGAAGYGERLGKLAAIRAIPAAGAPFLFALLHDRVGTQGALAALAVLGVLGALPLILLNRKITIGA